MACPVCKQLRKKCNGDCVFAQLFSAEEFNCVNKVFGGDEIKSMVEKVQVWERPKLGESLIAEASYRMADPVEGSYGIIKRLQQRIAETETRLFQEIECRRHREDLKTRDFLSLIDNKQ